MDKEKSIEDFFRSEDNSYTYKGREKKKKPAKVKVEDTHYYDKGRRESKFVSFFKNWFVFDSNVDLQDPTNVLYRRNFCIRSIIFLANLMFLVFSFVGISSTNFILTIVFFLAQTVLSQTINYMLRRKKDDYNQQILIMYLQSLFVFLLSVILYVKVYLGFTILDDRVLTTHEASISQAAYLLIFFSFVIISLYQSTKLLKNLFAPLLVIMIVINITLLHPDLFAHANTLSNLWNFLTGDGKQALVDIILRLFVFLVFYISLYVSASISFYMFKQRTTEVERRMDVEANFKDIVESVFESVRAYNTSDDAFELRLSVSKVAAVVKVIGVAMNYDGQTITDLSKFATIHSERMRELSMDGIDDINSTNFDLVLKKTKLATTIIRRLQISKKAVDIVYRYFEGVLDRSFLDKMTINPEDYESNILLISEIYHILRTDQTFKKALNHQRSIELIQKEFYKLFNQNLVTRFVKYSYEINTAYDKS